MLQADGGGTADGVDYCGFLTADASAEAPLLVSALPHASLCAGLGAAAGFELRRGCRVLSANHRASDETGPGGGWSLNLESAVDEEEFLCDALVLACADPTLAAAAVSSIGTEGAADEAAAATEQRQPARRLLQTPPLAATQNCVLAKPLSRSRAQPEPVVLKSSQLLATITFGGLARGCDRRLGELAGALRAQHEERTAPAFSWTGDFPAGALASAVPFDAATVPGSPLVQFIAREASMPGLGDGGDDGGLERWTAVSTQAFARAVARRGEAAEGAMVEEEEAAALLGAEVVRLLSPFFDGDAGGCPPPLSVSATRWGAGFCTEPMGHPLECISLPPWQLAVAGTCAAPLCSLETLALFSHSHRWLVLVRPSCDAL